MNDLGYDTPAHTAAQAKCFHIINHAIDAATRRAVHEAIDNARRTDMSGFEIAMAQLTGECEHRLSPNRKFEEFITNFEDEEIDRESDESMENLMGLINGAQEVDYFAQREVCVNLSIQTLDGGPYPTLTIELLPMVELAVPGLDIDDLVDTEHTGIEQALAILRTTYRHVEMTLANFRQQFAPVSA